MSTIQHPSHTFSLVLTEDEFTAVHEAVGQYTQNYDSLSEEPTERQTRLAEAARSIEARMDWRLSSLAADPAANLSGAQRVVLAVLAKFGTCVETSYTSLREPFVHKGTSERLASLGLVERIPVPGKRGMARLTPAGVALEKLITVLNP